MTNHTASKASVANNANQPDINPSPAIFSSQYHIYINHTDAGGIVYHGNHLTFFENCRRDWLNSLGIDSYFMTGTDDSSSIGHFVVKTAELDYRHAIHLDDDICVRIDRVVIRPASLLFYQSIYLNQSIHRRDCADSNQTQPATITHQPAKSHLTNTPQPAMTADQASTCVCTGKITLAYVSQASATHTHATDASHNSGGQATNPLKANNPLKATRLPTQLLQLLKHSGIE